MHAAVLSPKGFNRFVNRWIGLLAALTLLMLAIGLPWALAIAPTDYQQGESYRIIYLHVPSAWLSLMGYTMLAGLGFVVLVWRVKLAEVMAEAIAPVGAAFTFLALVTGSLWGRPMWGTYWVWDARLTSELVLLFLYLGWMALSQAIEDRRAAARACGVLALIGAVDIPIVHFSVEWWNTLHQGPTITRLDRPAMHFSMLAPLLWMYAALFLYAATVSLLRARDLWLEREANHPWVAELMRGDGTPRAGGSDGGARPGSAVGPRDLTAGA
jgi:heme exporter protein C